MSADIRYLKSKGLWSGEYKKLFSLPPADYPKPLKRLIDLIRADIQDGRSNNLCDWRSVHAVDCAYETPFNQHTPTLVRHILSQNLNEAETAMALKDYGLSESELFMTVKGQNGQDVTLPNFPVFYEVFIPIVRAYVDTVHAQIFNERNTSPLLPYKPLKETSRNRVLCEIWTDIAQTLSTWYGYPAVLEQAIQQMLKYGICLAFPLEEWHTEYQVQDSGDGTGPKRETIKEGIRYTHPHPTRMFYDLKYPLTSLNTDTGTEWCGYWHVLSYGQILDNRNYWNRKSIFAGTDWFSSPEAGSYFDEIYPCSKGFPTAAAGNGFNRNVTREDKAAWYTSSTQRNMSVFVTEYYRKLIPANFGLGDYKYPVWHHFTVAGDDTVIWCEPCAYTPAWFMGYNYDQMAARSPSLALELIPWQDTLGNLLSQMLLTSKQNLLKINLYDTNQLDKADISRFNNLGERKYRGWEWLGFDSMAKRMGNQNPAQAVIPINLPYASITEHLQMFPMVLNIMERVLGISAQDAGATASHQQSKAEVIQTSSSGKLRRARTAAGVDAGTDAWKRQLTDGFSAYGDPEVSAQVSADIEDLDTHLAELGLTKQATTKQKVFVTGHKKKLRLEFFAAANQGPLVPNEKEIAQAIMTAVQTIVGQPALFQRFGVETICDWIEQAVRLGGGPKDFRSNPKADDGKGDIPENVKEALMELSKQIMQTIEEKIAKPAAQQAAKTEGEVQQLESLMEQMKPIFDAAKASQDKNAIAEKDVAHKIQVRNAESQADEKRKQEKHDLEMQRMVSEAHVDREVKLEGAKTDVALKEHEAKKPWPSKVSESISYKDAPEEIRRQMEQQAGMTPPESPTYPKKEKAATKPQQPSK
jgi:hypothetical protein